MSDKIEKNQTLGYMNIPFRMSNFHVHHNASCVKCGQMHKEMIRVGAVIFCQECVEVEFKSDDPVRKERENYLKWLHKSCESEE